MKDQQYIGLMKFTSRNIARDREDREGDGPLSKLWDIHREAALVVGKMTIELEDSKEYHAAHAHIHEVPALMRTFFESMAHNTRSIMTKHGVTYAIARSVESGKTLRKDERCSKDRVKIAAKRAAASLLAEVPEEWITKCTLSFSRGHIGGRDLWSRHLQNALTAARKIFNGYAQLGDIPRRFAASVVKFEELVRTRALKCGRSWDESRKRVVKAALNRKLPKNRARAAAYTAAALLVSAMPDDSRIMDHMPPPPARARTANSPPVGPAAAAPTTDTATSTTCDPVCGKRVRREKITSTGPSVAPLAVHGQTVNSVPFMTAAPSSPPHRRRGNVGQSAAEVEEPGELANDSRIFSKRVRTADIPSGSSSFLSWSWSSASPMAAEDLGKGTGGTEQKDALRSATISEGFGSRPPPATFPRPIVPKPIVPTAAEGGLGGVVGTGFGVLPVQSDRRPSAPISAAATARSQGQLSPEGSRKKACLA